MTNRNKRFAATAVALSLGVGLSACGTLNEGPQNFSLDSVNQPIVERQNYTLDVASGGSGLSVPEQARLADWFETLDLGYGDRIAVDDPTASPAVLEDVAAVASRFGLLVSPDAPVTNGFVDPGNVRIVVTRSMASVPGCPIWRDQYGIEQGNQTSPGFGCAVNSNIAAMVANPEHLLEGESGTGDTVIMRSNRAIDAYREAEPSGNGGTSLPRVSSEGG
ncbi:CpaD family pilus assembly protein [Aurantiacibacter sediminis]|uniref:CpaD family pilus assembly protein n=1 Tax=Aurantiacibacter sediminis TaxID=2793064 RepID=A0ABS0N6A6_9SPHN|nr:CpaD family pilus assembly protein [Aurantiacibacter sediminis]MBH5323349.1 CpaD family pilus assembly protein [Aurantiacibacter sediminis]